MSHDAVRLRIELERALVRELEATWADLNYGHFRNKLRAPTIELSDAEERLGQWRLETRTLEISRTLAVAKPWGVVVEVLKHEMAHQFVHEVLGRADEPPHGPTFRAMCASLGIDASATGVPEASERPEAESRLLERVAKLLALAESPNANEAQAAATAAQRLMLKHNLDAASARAERGYSFRHLGRPSGRTPEHERLVATILGEHFFVETIWVPVYRPEDGKRASVLEVCGTPANLEMAAYVHAFLLHAAERLWAEHKRAHGIRGDRQRRTFLAGVMLGFRDKLRAQKKEDAQAGLVWVGDAELDAYYRRRHPRVRTVSRAGGERGEAHAHGREAGRNLVLHRAVQAAATSGGKLLPR